MRPGHRLGEDKWVSLIALELSGKEMGVSFAIKSKWGQHKILK